MDSSSIQLADSRVSSITLAAGELRIHFSRAIIIKTMTGSVERTLWWQAGELVLEEAELQTPLPQGDLICERGDIDENIYTYRDMIPIPLDSRGHIRCELHWQGGAPALVATAAAVRLEMQDTPKYQRHLRDEADCSI